MRKIVLLVRSVVFAALLSAVAAVAQQGAATPAAPVPSAIRSAQTIFISNDGADARLFEVLFKGDSNRAYNQFYAALSATGHYKLVGDPSDADLVLELDLRLPLTGPQDNVLLGGTASFPEPVLRLNIFDRKTHYTLWTLTEKVKFANRANSRDKNFDDAITALAAQFDQFTGKQAATH